jgi:3-methylcrotonyl-CoA carboxylase alpha subunit
MKYFLNGEPVEFEWTGEVEYLSDRLIVRTNNGSFSALAVRDGDAILVSYQGYQYRLETKKPRNRKSGDASSGEFYAPMPGQVVDVLVAQGDAVEKGQKVLVIEAMKTQQPFLAPFNGTVVTLNAEKGMQVKDGELLASIQKETE